MIFAGLALSKVILPLVIVGAVVGGVWSYGQSRYAAGQLSEQAKHRDAVDEANMRANQAGHRYEEWKLRQKARVVIRIKEVERALETAPDWRDTAVPDSVRRPLETDAAPNPTVPDGSVPAVSAP